MPIRKLTPTVHEKVWGSALTEPWLANPGRLTIGEVWFSAPDALPVLVKLLFTTERLSVQVHPGDTYARASGHARGKTEMWHVLRAEPGATIAYGLRESISGARLRESALSGGIVDLLNWVPALKGDTFFLPAGTIHAIGGGLVLCEVQQLSDVTYRLFDYRRQPERELHLEDAAAVSNLDPTPGGRGKLPVECAHFRVGKLTVSGSAVCDGDTQPAIYVAVEGEGRLAGEPFHAGEAWLVPADSPPFTIESKCAAFIFARPGEEGT
jgi:mannose-6-phosphate isomerase